MRDEQRCIALNVYQSRCERSRSHDSDFCNNHAGQLLTKGRVETIHGPMTATIRIEKIP